jgi:hypothetical protein
VIRAFIVYEGEVDPERYAQHVEICERVPGATFRHGKVFGNPMGRPDFAYYAEFEFPDRESFMAASGTPEFAETGRDGMDMGVPFKVHFADIE